jgi:hypothetical protein
MSGARFPDSPAPSGDCRETLYTDEALRDVMRVGACE